jgi:hypothetical protein
MCRAIIRSIKAVKYITLYIVGCRFIQVRRHPVFAYAEPGHRLQHAREGV